VHDLSHRLLVAPIIPMREGSEGLLVMVKAAGVEDLNALCVTQVVAACSEHRRQQGRPSVFGAQPEITDVAYGEGVCAETGLTDNEGEATDRSANIILDQEAERIMCGALSFKHTESSGHTTPVLSDGQGATKGDRVEKFIDRRAISARGGT
jgi:hypothetical protein